MFLFYEIYDEDNKYYNYKLIFIKKMNDFSKFIKCTNIIIKNPYYIKNNINYGKPN
jgi:hypothetical protein